MYYILGPGWIFGLERRWHC